MLTPAQTAAATIRKNAHTAVIVRPGEDPYAARCGAYTARLEAIAEALPRLLAELDRLAVENQERAECAVEG